MSTHKKATEIRSHYPTHPIPLFVCVYGCLLGCLLVWIKLNWIKLKAKSAHFFHSLLQSTYFWLFDLIKNAFFIVQTWGCYYTQKDTSTKKGFWNHDKIQCFYRNVEWGKKGSLLFEYLHNALNLSLSPCVCVCVCALWKSVNVKTFHQHHYILFLWWH